MKGWSAILEGGLILKQDQQGGGKKNHLVESLHEGAVCNKEGRADAEQAFVFAVASQTPCPKFNV